MKAMVLSAGMGTRLGGLTRDVPKPMLEVRGRPILAHILANLVRHGFDQVVINLHFQPAAIRDHFGNGEAFGLQITYIEETNLLGTAGGVKNAEAFFRGPDPVLVHYGDVLTDQDFTTMLAFHNQKHAQATLLLHQRARSNSVVCLDGEQRVELLLERPDEETRSRVVSPWVNSGVYLLDPSVLDAIPAGLVCDLPRDVLPELVTKRNVFGFPLTGYRCAIDSPERLEQAQEAPLELASPDRQHLSSNRLRGTA